jgi:muramoyltetrapeptide carboxypeptidase LdcA involved in peptidoglycan recycling
MNSDELAMHPEMRAKDLMTAFRNPEVKGIISAIGGSDTIRLLKYVDLDVIKSNPKIFLGYSDTTINHFMCYRAGLSSMYGPSIMSGFAENGGMTEYAKDSIKRTLFRSDPIGKVHQSDSWTGAQIVWDNPRLQMRPRKRQPTNWRYLQGDAPIKGRLIGGCMESIEMLLGTELFPRITEFIGTVLFLENSTRQDIPEFVSSRLRNYGSLGILEAVNGIIFGRPGGDCSSAELSDYDSAVSSVMKEFGCEDKPVVTRLDFGHTDPVFVIPYGAMVEIDPIHGSIEILDNAVVKSS